MQVVTISNIAKSRFTAITTLLTAVFTLKVGYTKTFVFCPEGPPSAFNPQIVSDGPSIAASAFPLYNRLVDFEYGTTTIIPSLAKSWEISKDGLKYVFNLREDVTFHNTKYFEPTRKMNADDVLYSFKRMMDKNHPYYKVGGGIYEYFDGMGMAKIVKDVRKLGEYKIEIELSKPEAPFLGNLAMPFMSVLSKEYAEMLIKKDQKDHLDIYPVGTGPFFFRKYVKDNQIRYRRHKSYFEGPTKIKNLVFSITPDASVRYQKLKAEECHLIVHPNPSDLDSMAKNENIELLSEPGMNVGYLAMNTEKKPLNNPKVRQAINMALNKQSYIDAIYLGNAVQAVNPLPPGIWSYDKKSKAAPYNTAKAKKLLADAGFAKGLKLDLWALPINRPYNPNGKKMAEMMKEDLQKIGVEVKLVQYDWPTYLKKSNAGEHELLQIGWSGDNGDPDNFLNTLLACSASNGGSNYARWCNKEYDQLVIEAKRTTDQQKRSKLYIKAQKIFRKELPWAPLAHAKVYRAMSKKVVGYKLSPTGNDIMTYVDLK